MNTTRRRIAFRSKPVSRNSAPGKQRYAIQWQPSGPFRFLDLPPELRADILRLAIADARRHHTLVNMMLVCEQLHDEVASVARKSTVIDLTKRSGTVTHLADAFSSVSSNARVSLWRHVGSLVICMYLVDHINVFCNSLGTALQHMTQHNSLRSLRLEIRSKFPSDDFWGSPANATDGDSRDSVDEANTASGRDVWQYSYFTTGSTRRTKGLRETDIFAPNLISTLPFQDLLKFLYQCEVPHISFLVDASDHHRFWCAFHQKTKAVQDFATVACAGIPPGARHADIDWRELIRAFAGARLS
ncbi:uncharacterized protein B0I36DRAFT_361518 [Microdochium trichocladiopsis]|uniref:F-box domain-containing protein n=1 Tax=Microdochium trichocladiopsis TaxID=1682393 RepID=A0A9P8Y621_9PEZI|nr:uncharacterized protein B0I36DRAFT_361518 [Microdochium trichocladiopsis]KAH7032745.1 hypothetical protein B0I36DRAFT_361518 [Microdochium trichocladiopsis]